MATEFDVATVATVYDKLTTAGVSKSDAAVIAGHWVIAQAGKGMRVFSYSAALAQIEAACAAQFNRTFAHTDWIDGESVVQAEETTVEEGFNKRFHAIEADLDTLGVDVKKSFQCLAELRVSLKALLEEVRAEINRLNKDVFDCCRRVEVFPSPTINPPLLDWGRFAGMVNLYGKPMQLWETKAGTLVLPLPPKGGGGDPWEDPRITRVSELSRLLGDNPAIKKHFTDAAAAGTPVKVDDLVKSVGDELSPGGLKLKDVVTILPPGATVKDAAELLDTVSEREAAALRTSGLSTVARTATLGVGTDVEKVGEVRLDQFEAIPKAQRTALVAAGISTLDKLSASDTRAIASALKRAGLTATAGEISGWQATAKTMILIG